MKPFLSIDGQVALLESRGVATDASTAGTLLREGYYSVVNGYKGPFIDPVATTRAGDDRYAAGTRFSDIYELFKFDRALRELTFHYLVLVEAECRTVIAHTFSESHPDYKAYIDQTSYASREEYEAAGFSHYLDDVAKLTGILSKKAQRSGHVAIEHYREAYGAVPIWVLTNDLTFGNMEHFFNLMKRAEQLTVCKRITQLNGHAGSRELGYFDSQEAIRALNTLVKARNMCAHDERLYCARIGGERADGYGMVLQRMRRFLTDAQFAELSAGVLDLASTSFQRAETVPHVLDKMGLARTADGLRPVTAL